jgi:subtilase family serine protease
MRSVHVRGSVLAALGAAAVLVVATVATPTSAGAAGTTKVQVPLHLCKTASAGHKSCHAMKLVTRQVSSAKAASLRSRGLARPSKTLGFGPAGGYTPRQLAAAYGINPGVKTKQTVAIVDAFANPSVRADLNAFDHHYGLPKETAKSFRVINQDGHASPLPTPDEGWAGEITLDVQSVRAVCHSCKILLVEADSNNNSDLAAGVNQAVKKGAKIVSNSYGGPEGHGQRAAYRHKGVAILASTGDDGWYDWDSANSLAPSSNMPATPASFPSVVAVSGTSLYLNPNGSRTSETVWNGNGPADLDGASTVAALGYEPGAAGGGCSTLFKAPSWQRQAKGYGTLGCGAKRSGTDIAAIADPFTGFDIFETFDWCTDPDQNVCPFTSADNGWATFGGTSLATPVVAGLWGLAGGPVKGVPSPGKTLYANFKHKRGTYDVTVGGTGGCNTQSPRACGGLLGFLVYGDSFSSPNPNTGPLGLVDCAWGPTGNAARSARAQCYARPGYDGVSGVGTPKGLAVFK